MKAVRYRRMVGERCVSCAVTVALLSALWAGTGTAGTPVEVVPGDAAEQVVAKLGKPQGRLTYGRIMVFLYERGLIDFEDDRVVYKALVTVEEAERLKQERARAEEERRGQAEAERQRTTDAGLAELVETLSDEQFAKRAPSERLAYWQEFSQRYPYTNVSNLAARAEAEVEAERRQQETQAELAALNARVGEIQARFIQLDADYMASLTRWKRDEINAERASLTEELGAAQSRIRALEGQTGTNGLSQASTDSGQ